MRFGLSLRGTVWRSAPFRLHRQVAARSSTAELLDGGRPELDPLPHENLLSTLGEVAAAFVGFSIVAGLLRSGSIRRFHSMRDVAQIGLQAVAASFLPLAIHAYGASPALTWRTASAAFLALWATGLGFAIKGRLSRDPDEFRVKRVRIAINGALNVTGGGLLLFNIALAGPGSGARYASAVLLLLAIAGIQFLDAAFGTPPDSPAV